MILKITLNKLENEVILDSLFLEISFLIQNHGVSCIRVSLVATGAIKYYLN